ncbi:MAG: hypothetical protein KA275_03210 [Chitinophagaceae bacterium]|nr:hypothetical protein [Chitinophagaceae bacterium]
MKKYLGIGFIILFFISCKQRGNYQGDLLMNYLDVEEVLRKNLDIYKKDPVMVSKITYLDGKRDSTALDMASMPWNEIEAPFKKANIQKKALDRKYKIDILTDTTTHSITLLYKALSNDVFTKSISMRTNDNENKMQSLYIEADEKNLVGSSDYRLLYVKGKSIQIQERIKKPFSKLKTTITTYTFLN